MRKFFSLILALTILTTLCPVAFAEDDTVKDYEKRGYSAVEIEPGTWLVSKHFDNGDIKAYQIEGRSITYEIFYNSNLDSIICYDLLQSQGTTTDIISLSEYRVNTLAEKPAQKSGTFVYAGKITYRYYNQGFPIQLPLTVSYCYEGPVHTTFNLHGSFSSSAAVIISIVTLLLVPEVTALQVFHYLLDIASLVAATSGAYNVIDPGNVNAYSHTMTWKGVNGTSITGTFFGRKYVISQAGYSGITRYENTYCEPYALAQHSMVLANAIASCVNFSWGDGQYEVIGWETAH